MANKKTPAAGGAAGAGRWPANASNAIPNLGAAPKLTAADHQLLAQRIGHLRQQQALGCAGLEAAAGRLIDRYPHCPRPASLLVDRLIRARDLAIWEGRR